MQIEKVKQILRKVNALVDNLDDHGQTSAIERDLLKRYLTELYEDVAGIVEVKKPFIDPEIPEQSDTHLPSATDTNPATSASQTAVPDLNPPTEDQTTYYDADATPQIEHTNHEPAGATINNFTESVKYYPPQDEVEEPNPEPVVQSRTEREAIPLATDVVVEDDRFNELFNTTDPSDLAAKFATGRINSIDSAMGINQRLLTVNELFGGDMQSFNASIAKLNGYESFDEARKFLIEGPATSYGWDSEAKLAMAKDFIQIVRRRFL